MTIVPRKISRALRLLPQVYGPEEERVLAERRLRGETEFAKLQQADCVVVSYGKSGRTWMRVMLSRFYQIRHGISERHVMAFDNLHRKIPSIPIIFFTHDNYLKDFTGNRDNKSDYYDKKLVLLARHPADVAVSQFYQWKYRMRPQKMALNDYPPHGEQIENFDFVMRPQCGIGKIIDFMNLWADEAGQFQQFLLLRYEDMRKDPNAMLEGVLAFIGTSGTPDEICAAVEFASMERMREREQRPLSWLRGIRLAPGDRSNPDTYKVRRGKVAGYRDNFTEDQLAQIDGLVLERLSPFYGYGPSPRPAPRATE
jgi:hypothetical protein